MDQINEHSDSDSDSYSYDVKIKNIINNKRHLSYHYLNVLFANYKRGIVITLSAWWRFCLLIWVGTVFIDLINVCENKKFTANVEPLEMTHLRRDSEWSNVL